MLKNKYLYLIAGIFAFLLYFPEVLAGLCCSIYNGGCGDKWCTGGLCLDCGFLSCTICGCGPHERLIEKCSTCYGESGTYFACVCICDSSCGADSACNGYLPEANITHCGCGATYFADKCNSDCGCQDRDSICRSSAYASDCTAASSCNGVAAGSSLPDSCELSYLRVNRYCSSFCTYSETVYTCDSAHCGDSKSCGGSTYYCVYDNGWKWSTSKPTNFCCSNADCNDNDLCTTDTCGSDYRCSHTTITTSITFDSSPQGSGFVSVDGVAITTPQTYSWTCGSTHTLSANSPVYPSCCPALRYIFSSWSDGGAQTHTITVPSSPTTYTANFNTQVYLAVQANPSAGGSVSGSGWYDVGTTATISATANAPCYIFSNWTANWGGGYTGTANPASVSINLKAVMFAAGGNTPTETANFGYNDGASCSGTPYCSGTNRCGGSEGDTRYYDFKCQSGNCVATSSENCRCDASDSDGGLSYTTYGSCTDYKGCSGGSCQSTTYYDSCSGDTLTEYYVSGSGDSATCASTTYNCKNLGSDYICSGGRCTNCKKDGEACSSTSDCCSYYTSGTTCYYSPDCVSTGGALAPLSQPTLSFSDSFINKISFGIIGQPICEFSTCSIADSCTANTLTVGKTCSASGCSSGTSYTCNSNTHTNCQAVSCGGSTYYCTYDGSSWQWRTSKPAEVCNDNIDNDCDGKTDCSDSDCSSDPSCGTCSYSLSIDPSSGSYSDTTNTWGISATDRSNSYCPSTITYTITYSTSGSCDSSNTYVNPTSFSISRGSTFNAFIVKVTRTGNSCTLSLSVKDPNGNVVATGSYTVSQAAPTTYTLNVNSAVDVLGTALAGVQITVDGTSKSTDSSGKTTFSLSTGSHTITAQASFNGRPFSHFWDHDANADCNQNDPYDTANNPYSFTMNACTRDITAWYKVFTHFQNSAGTQGAIDYDGTTISGYLLREDNQPLHYSGGTTVSLEYYDGSWHSIGTTTASSANGYFSYSWSCVAGATQIRASFTDSSWYYTSSSGTKAVSCPSGQPDLIIEDIWSSGSTIYYRIKNQGNANAGASTSRLTIDGSNVATDSVGNLAAGASSDRSFSYSWTCSGASDTVTVCADVNNAVSESDETNNCRTETWNCADTTPPTCSISSITESSAYAYSSGSTIWYNTLSTGSFTVTVSASDNVGVANVSFPATVSAGGVDTTPPYSWIYNWATTSTYSGTATVTAYDAASNTGTCSFNVVRDVTAPTTTASVAGSYTIALSCSDNVGGSGCDKTYYCIDTTNTCNPTTQYTGPITTSCSAICYIRYYSIDRVSNQESTKWTQFGPAVGDTTPPTTSINPNGKTWTNQDVSFTLTCSDNVGCAETKYSIIDAIASCPSYASLANTGTSGIVSCNTVCQKAVCYASKDLAGNTESVHKSNTFYIDKVLPTGDININPTAPTSADQVTYTATGSDAESGLSQIRIYVDGGLQKTCASSPCSYTGGPYAAGSTHSYSAVIYDIAGNSYTVSKTFTVNAVCNNNGICEVYALNIGENQTGCPGDCKTVAYFTPSWNVLPGQEVAITVYFNDSRWDSTRDASLNLTIDGKEWTNCQVQNKKWKADIGWPGVNGVWSGTYGGKPVRITSYLGYAKLETNCTLPTWLTSGTHYFVATPTLYSKPVTLTPATSKFTVGTASIKPASSFNLFLQFLKSLLLI
jgi:hypothetical protein